MRVSELVEFDLSIGECAAEMFCAFHGLVGDDAEHIKRTWGPRGSPGRDYLRWLSAAIAAIGLCGDRARLAARSGRKDGQMAEELKEPQRDTSRRRRVDTSIREHARLMELRVREKKEQVDAGDWPHWRQMSMDDLFAGLTANVHELRGLAKREVGIAPGRVKRQAADISNFALFIARRVEEFGDRLEPMVPGSPAAPPVPMEEGKE